MPGLAESTRSDARGQVYGPAGFRGPGPGGNDAGTVEVTHRPPIYAHRLGSEYGPESSRTALEGSLAHGAEGVECDVCMSADGEVMVIHDPYLPLSTDLDGWAHERPAAELQRARLRGPDGDASDEHPMRLDELLERVGAALPLQLDIKAYADERLARQTAAAASELVARHDASAWVEVISFFAGACVIAADRKLRSRLVVWSDQLPLELAKWSVSQGLVGISCEGFILGPRLVEAVRGAGLSLSVGGVNSAEQAAKVLPYAPAILVSDSPGTLRRALSAP
jgi:glycerophosphoryl diester phosphodiesterase